MKKQIIEKILKTLLLSNHKGLILDFSVDIQINGDIEIVLLLDGTDEEQEEELEEEITNYLSLYNIKPYEFTIKHVVQGDEGWDYSNKIYESEEKKDGLKIFIDDFNDRNSEKIDGFFGSVKSFIKYVLRKGRITDLDSDELVDYLNELSDDVFIKIYEIRPELFEKWSLQRRLNELNIKELPQIDYKFTLDLSPDEISRYVKGDWVVSRRKVKKKTPAGYEYETTIETTIFETILAGEVWNLWEPYDSDWKSAVRYYLDSKTEQRLWEIVKQLADSKNLDISNLDLEEAIEEVDEDYEIANAIGSAVNDAEADDYVNYLTDTLKDCLEELGKIIKFDDSGVTLELDIRQFWENVDVRYLDGYFDDCGLDMKCIFGELRYNEWIELPEFSTDDRWTPDVNENFFNELLNDRLNDLSL